MQLQNQIKMPPKQSCQSQDIIYEYSVSTSVNSDKVYLGTAGGFKKREVITTTWNPSIINDIYLF